MPSIVLMQRLKVEDTNSQYLPLFTRGYLMSGALKNSGSIQFPNIPISIGITNKKIMVRAWDEIITL